MPLYALYAMVPPPMRAVPLMRGFAARMASFDAYPSTATPAVAVADPSSCTSLVRLAEARAAASADAAAAVAEAAADLAAMDWPTTDSSTTVEVALAASPTAR